MSVIVHTTPPLDGLPASDGASLRLLGTLRAAGVNAQVRTADWSQNGKPYVTLDNEPVPRSQLASLPGWRDPDAALDSKQRADAVVWDAYVDETVVDLVNHSLYSLPPNWPHLAQAQIATLSFPMTQYVPERLRSVYAARLRHVGLWGLGGVHDGDLREEDQKKLDESFVVGPAGTKVPRKWSGWHAGREIAERRRKFGEQALRERYEAAFGPLARKLGKHKFFYGSKLSSLDIALWAQLALVLDSKLPNDLLAQYLGEKHPELVNLHHRVQKTLFAQGWPERLAPPTPPTLLETVSQTVNAWWPFAPRDKPANAEQAQQITEDQKFKYARWAWFAGASAALVGYLLLSGIVVFGDVEEWDEEEIWIGGDEEEDGEEEEIWLGGEEEEQEQAQVHEEEEVQKQQGQPDQEEQQQEEQQQEQEEEGLAEFLYYREPTSSLPVWDDEEAEEPRREEAPQEEYVEEEVYAGLPVWGDEDEAEAERQRQENTRESVSDEVDLGPLGGEPTPEEEVIDDFNPATAQG